MSATNAAPGWPDSPWPDALWAATAAPAPDTPALDAYVSCDVASVGGGFTGLSTALHLAERGVNGRVIGGSQPRRGGSARHVGEWSPGGKDEPSVRGSRSPAAARQPPR
ncbi:FAD-dependent oxidoreductase, partial [Burkholderia cenocepacia]|uniref:FAD-dependent oxidoreductase n=1 Tax=Burkholderia cenocepacia TaxID=95486 RepID=UPI00406CACFB